MLGRKRIGNEQDILKKPFTIILQRLQPIYQEGYMFLFRFLAQTISIIIAALLGNWTGEQIRENVTGERGHKLQFTRQNEQGETVIAVNPLLTNLLPAVYLGLTRRPNIVYAFLGGLAASAIFGNKHEDEFLKMLREGIREMRQRAETVSEGG
jgi:hypothetical protein